MTAILVIIYRCVETAFCLSLHSIEWWQREIPEYCILHLQGSTQKREEVQSSTTSVSNGQSTSWDIAGD
jgi:hypothetical protein